MPEGVERNTTADRKEEDSTTSTYETSFSYLKIHNFLFQKYNIKGQPQIQ
jgi:hypothetical protein